MLRAVTLSALNKGFEVIGIQKGYLGLLDTKYLVPLTTESVRGITHLSCHKAPVACLRTHAVLRLKRLQLSLYLCELFFILLQVQTD